MSAHHISQPTNHATPQRISMTRHTASRHSHYTPHHGSTSKQLTPRPHMPRHIRTNLDDNALRFKTRRMTPLRYVALLDATTHLDTAFLHNTRQFSMTIHASRHNSRPRLYTPPLDGLLIIEQFPYVSILVCEV